MTWMTKTGVCLYNKRTNDILLSRARTHTHTMLIKLKSECLVIRWHEKTVRLKE